MTLLVRTWNVFHGRTFPETDRTHLAEMVGLVAEDGPDVVCLQEVPVWALRRLAGWSGMAAVGAVAVPALGGPAARRLTGLDPGRLRSALTGQANAVLVSSALAVVGRQRTAALNPPSVRRREARRLGLPRRTRIAWGRNRRVAQIVRVAAPGTTVLVVNLHLTSSADSRPAEVELARAVDAAEAEAGADEPIVLAGDLNLTPASSEGLRALAGRGYRGGGAGVDHVHVRGLELARTPEPWPDERRRLGEVLLSDHAPVEAAVVLP